jgi:hypothetical protein
MDWLIRGRAIWRPGMFHGHGLRHNFFEGWYFKFADASEQNVRAVIPGVFLASSAYPEQESHAFIQTLDGRTGASHYHRYPLTDFSASTTEFDLRIGRNHFWAGGLELNIDRPDQRLFGELRFAELVPWPVALLSPGVMGWYALVPFMECYHGVLGLDHGVDGRLQVNGREIDFSAGRGYIEKDWGQAFPRAWIWMQTNHFGQPGVCLTASVARIPWLGTAFRGFIVGLWHAGRLYRFATYTGAAITHLSWTDTHVRWGMQDGHHSLEIEARRSSGGLLHAPSRTAMLQRLLESLTAEVSVRLSERASKREIFAGTGRNAGLELGGEVDTLLK